MQYYCKMKKTIELLNVAASQIYTNGVIGDLFSLGGGLIGAAFSVVFAMLFSYTGMIALSIILMVVGACLFTGFSIFDFFTERLEEHQEEKKKGKEKEEKRSIFSFFKRDRDDDEDEEFDNTKQMSLSFDNVPINGQTAIGKKTYNSIEELNNSKQKINELQEIINKLNEKIILYSFIFLVNSFSIFFSKNYNAGNRKNCRSI